MLQLLYLISTKFTVRTDLHALKRVLNLAKTNCRPTRCLVGHITYECDIVHQAFTKHWAPDVLWSLSTELTEESDVNEDIAVVSVSIWAQKRHNKRNFSTPGQSHIETKEPQLPTLDRFMSVERKKHIAVALGPP